MTAKRFTAAAAVLTAFICLFSYISTGYVLSADDSEMGSGFIHEYTDDGYSSPVQGGEGIFLAENLPSHYDLRDEGCVTPVRHQGAEGTCSSFAAVAACESNLLKQGLETDPESLDLSEAQLAYFLYTLQPDPSDPLYGDYIDTPGKGADGGNGIRAAAGLAEGMGLEKEEYCLYSDWGNGYSEYSRYAGQYRISQFEHIVRAENESDRNRVKHWLMDNGGVLMAFCSKRTLYYDNGESYSYYAEGRNFKSDANHAALIVGWDDDYKRENFSPDSMPPSDGAWLVKNSYGPDLFDDGYFWISYDDPSVGSLCSYVTRPVSDHDDIYEYDGAGYYKAYSFDKAANVFTAEHDSVITDVSFYMPDNPPETKYRIFVYRLNTNTDNPEDGVCIGAGSGVVPPSGYYTVPLQRKAEVKRGEQFSVVMSLSCPDKTANVYLPIEERCSITSTFRLRCGAGRSESYVCTKGRWEDTTDDNGKIRDNGEENYFGNIPLKALAVRTDEYTPYMLKTAIMAAETSGVSDKVLDAALADAYSVLESGAGAQSCRRAAGSLLAVLEKCTKKSLYPSFIYSDERIKLGDANLDGRIDTADATEVLRMYAFSGAGKTYRVMRTQKAAMNAVFDSDINIDDAAKILATYAKSGAGM